MYFTKRLIDPENLYILIDICMHTNYDFFLDFQLLVFEIKKKPPYILSDMITHQNIEIFPVETISDAAF